jgi:hypothetical protein
MARRSEERARFLGDVISTAVEGGTGYWAQVSQYQYELHGRISVSVGERVGDEPRAALHPLTDDETSYQEKAEIVTLDVVAKGIALIVSGKTSVFDALRRQIAQADRENDAGEIDADGADVIVQAGLFGQVIYG